MILVREWGARGGRTCATGSSRLIAPRSSREGMYVKIPTIDLDTSPFRTVSSRYPVVRNVCDRCAGYPVPVLFAKNLTRE